MSFETDFLTHPLPAPPPRIDFEMIKTAALDRAEPLLLKWLPDGEIRGREFVARNPRRLDRNAGSFRINLHTGRWADFATGDRGGDLIALCAFLFGLRQGEAAKRIAGMLSMQVEEAVR
jgi:hypothetical protein